MATVITASPLVGFSCMLALWLAVMSMKRFSEVSSRALPLALPLSVICPATMIRAIATAKPMATFLSSVVRSPKAVLSFSFCMCMAATMLLATSYQHLEHFGTLPIGRGSEYWADNG
uniref:Uncharacterized protein n=1 Tax=uncultured marine group II/III euryarchaeote AD1000_39_H06 TaxID=1457765 RepID=A0A075FVT0_9EURY|nr:hypothetical protein [uncultured marine group II/III euryarchaeote AD1000_39_H06]